MMRGLLLLAVWDGASQTRLALRHPIILFYSSASLLLYGSARVFLNTLLVCNVDVKWGSAISLDFS